MECLIERVKNNRAMKNYERAQFLFDFAFYSVTSLIACFVFSSPFWFPFVKQILSAISNMSLFLNAKCFFVVGNLIVIILIGESKLKHSSRSSSTSDVYHECGTSFRKVKSMHNLKVEEKKHGSEGRIYLEEKKREMKKSKSASILHEEKKAGRMRACKSEVWGESENACGEKISKGKKEENHHISRDELNKRVEAFIARVNKQRLLEAKLV